MNNKFLYENINNYIKAKLENQKIQIAIFGPGEIRNI